MDLPINMGCLEGSKDSLCKSMAAVTDPSTHKKTRLP